MKKLLKKINWNNVRLLFIAGLALFLYAFSNHKNEKRAISQIDVLFKGKEGHFVTETDVKNLVNKNFLNTPFIGKTMLDLNRLEKNVLENELIKRAEVYLTVDGKLKVDVWQKQALGRIIQESSTFYLDEEGQKIPVSINFSERVPVIQGKVDKYNQEQLKQMLEIIREDEFLKKDITGIAIDEGGSVLIKSRINNYDIVFGRLEEIDRKLKNYKAFVEYTMHDQIDVNSYKTINLKFTQQVVCTK
jgi:cell division protein FtsQ